MNNPKRATEAFYQSALFEAGIGHVVVARFKGDGSVEIGCFLVDVFCLGVKNAFFVKMTALEYESRLDELVGEGDERISIEPGDARNLIEGAVAYAKQFGLAPHRDYKKGKRVFGGISGDNCDQTFEYGQDGKPLFIQGPFDTPQRVNQVMASLTRKCDEGNFHYVLPIQE